MGSKVEQGLQNSTTPVEWPHVPLVGKPFDLPTDLSNKYLHPDGIVNTDPTEGVIFIPELNVYSTNKFDFKKKQYSKPHLPNEDNVHQEMKKKKKPDKIYSVTGVNLGSLFHGLLDKNILYEDYNSAMVKEEDKSPSLLLLEGLEDPTIATALKTGSKKGAEALLEDRPAESVFVPILEPLLSVRKKTRRLFEQTERLFKMGKLPPGEITEHLGGWQINPNANFSEKKSKLLQSLFNYSLDKRKGKNIGMYKAKPDGMFFDCSPDNHEESYVLKALPAIFTGNMLDIDEYFEHDYAFGEQGETRKAKEIMYTVAKGLETGKIHLKFVEAKFETYQTAEEFREGLLDIYAINVSDYNNNGNSELHTSDKTDGDPNIRKLKPIILPPLPPEKMNVLYGLPRELLANIRFAYWDKEEKTYVNYSIEHPAEFADQPQPQLYKKNDHTRKQIILENVTPAVIAWLKLLRKAKQHFGEDLDTAGVLSNIDAIGLFTEYHTHPFHKKYPYPSELIPIEAATVKKLYIDQDELVQRVLFYYDLFIDVPDYELAELLNHIPYFSKQTENEFRAYKKRQKTTIQRSS